MSPARDHHQPNTKLEDPVGHLLLETLEVCLQIERRIQLHGYLRIRSTLIPLTCLALRSRVVACLIGQSVRALPGGTRLEAPHPGCHLRSRVATSQEARRAFSPA